MSNAFNIPRNPHTIGIDQESKISKAFSVAQSKGLDKAFSRFKSLDESTKQYMRTTDASQYSIAGLNQHLN